MGIECGVIKLLKKGCNKNFIFLKKNEKLFFYFTAPLKYTLLTLMKHFNTTYLFLYINVIYGFYFLLTIIWKKVHLHLKFKKNTTTSYFLEYDRECITHTFKKNTKYVYLRTMVNARENPTTPHTTHQIFIFSLLSPWSTSRTFLFFH